MFFWWVHCWYWEALSLVVHLLTVSSVRNLEAAASGAYVLKLGPVTVGATQRLLLLDAMFRRWVHYWHWKVLSLIVPLLTLSSVGNPEAAAPGSSRSRRPSKRKATWWWVSHFDILGAHTLTNWGLSPAFGQVLTNLVNRKFLPFLSLSLSIEQRDFFLSSFRLRPYGRILLWLENIHSWVLLPSDFISFDLGFASVALTV